MEWKSQHNKNVSTPQTYYNLMQLHSKYQTLLDTEKQKSSFVVAKTFLKRTNWSNYWFKILLYCYSNYKYMVLGKDRHADSRNRPTYTWPFFWTKVLKQFNVEWTVFSTSGSRTTVWLYLKNTYLNWYLNFTHYVRIN